jgi:RNA polymerase sigma factor (TIGR02999 family)
VLDAKILKRRRILSADLMEIFGNGELLMKTIASPDDTDDANLRESSQSQEEFDQIYLAIYKELKRLAAYFRSPQAHQTMSATDVVQEAYLKLRVSSNTLTRDPLHFKRIAAVAMRQIMIDAAKRKSSQSRGGQFDFISLTQANAASPAPDVDVLDLNRALDLLATKKARVAEIVVLRYYGGLTKEEIRASFDLSDSTIDRDLREGIIWLTDALTRYRRN